MKKTDYIFIASFLLFILVLFLLKNLTSPSSEVVIYKNSSLFGRYDLYSNQIINVGDDNTVVISDRQVYMQNATCPDKLCIHQGKISAPNNPIVCMPNKVVVNISSKKNEFDALAN